MSALIATAAMAVSVTVIGIAPAPVKHAFETPNQATLQQAVDQWAASASLPAPQIDARVATLTVGHVTVAGDNVCDAVAKLVSALKYADQRPQLKTCGTSAAPMIIGDASH